MPLDEISVEEAAELISKSGAGPYEDVREFILNGLKRQRALVDDIKAGKIAPIRSGHAMPGIFRRRAQPS